VRGNRGDPVAWVCAGLSDHIPVAATVYVPGRATIPKRPLAVPTSKFDETSFQRVREALAETGWSERGEGEAAEAWLTRLTARIGAAVHAAHEARKGAAARAFGGGSRETELVYGDYCSALRLRSIAAQHPASFDESAFRASALMHKKAGLWRLAPRADREGAARILTHLKKRTRVLARIVARRRRADGLDVFARLVAADRVGGRRPLPCALPRRGRAAQSPMSTSETNPLHTLHPLPTLQRRERS
jgi:hypothetical protein